MTERDDYYCAKKNNFKPLKLTIEMLIMTKRRRK